MIEQVLNGMALGVGFALGSRAVDLIAAAYRWAGKNPA